MVWRPKQKDIPVIENNTSNTNPTVDNFVNGIVDPNRQFVRASGADLSMSVDMSLDFLNFLWNISFGMYIPRILGPETTERQLQFPLNPLAIFNQILVSIVSAWSGSVHQAPIQTKFSEKLCEGLFIPSVIWKDFVTVYVVDTMSDTAVHTSTWESGYVSNSAMAELEKEVYLASDPDRGDEQRESTPAIIVQPEGKMEKAQTGSARLTSYVSEKYAVDTSTHIGRMTSNEKTCVDTSQLRRSTRSTRYDGFRAPQPTDGKISVSKVKQRIKPVVTVNSKAAAPHNSDQKAEEAVPPPMAIQTIQCIGTNLCGIPAEDLSAEKLLASLRKETPNAH